MRIVTEKKGPMAALAIMGALLFCAMPKLGFAQETSAAALPQATADILWLLIAAVLVFLMQAGFAMVETGLTTSKSACNIMMKNMLDFAIGVLCFWGIGYAIMYSSAGGFLGLEKKYLFMQAALPGGETSFADANTESANWVFQVVFAATAATIVSGAVAERTKLVAYLFYAVLISGLIYPVAGHWIWGENGFLGAMGMRDFAGSTVVHSVGAWAALAGAIVIGPRHRKYGPGGKVNAIPGHNMPLAALGVFLLIFGWFGFNAGSTLSAMPGIAHVAMTTMLACGGGAVAAMTTSWFKFGKPDLSMTLNGALAGLVGITAPCASVGFVSAVIIGAVAGVLVVFSVLFFDRVLKIDDPVGAISVHGVCGFWGTAAVGLFGSRAIDLNYWDAETAIHDGLFMGGGFAQLIPQVIGAGVVFLFTFGVCMAMFLILRATVGVRVTIEEEEIGVDISEHGNEAYPDYTIKSPMTS